MSKSPEATQTIEISNISHLKETLDDLYKNGRGDINYVLKMTAFSVFERTCIREFCDSIASMRTIAANTNQPPTIVIRAPGAEDIDVSPKQVTGDRRSPSRASSPHPGSPPGAGGSRAKSPPTILGGGGGAPNLLPANSVFSSAAAAEAARAAAEAARAAAASTSDSQETWDDSQTDQAPW